MLDSLRHADQLARDWKINSEDILLIALNSCGARSSLGKPRMRFRLRLDSRPDQPLYLILSLGNRQSPFEVDQHQLRLNGVQVGTVEGIEDDDAVLGYWRGGRRVLTLNSNTRSQCTGCVFCPNTLEDASDPRLRAPDLHAYFSTLACESGLPDLGGVEAVTVCTGCFLYEDLALEHLRLVREAMSANDCNGTLQFLSSVLTTPQGLDAAAAIGPFHLTLTAECFTRRDLVLKESKARLTPPQMIATLAAAKDRGIATNFTYIVGMDDANASIEGLAAFVPVTTAFPGFQIYQAHTPLMELQRATGSDQIQWHLAMRTRIEELFADTGLRPAWFRNYRSLWCFTFAGQELEGPWI
ncbi:radical SAM protein [Actinomadura hibisca]|uniref:radical SAM protein n=1 Tax=Actinomadura hibisca TaxID=68565 RepID=UPI000829808D|nr:radical SAM protein [Actinomadura hibisca]